jgi:predicted phage terminase large subunit-like protein
VNERAGELAKLFEGEGEGGELTGAERKEISQQASPLLPQDSSLEESPQALIQAVLQREKARTNLISFAEFVCPGYVAFPVHRLIAKKLEEIEAGKIRRLAIYVPPASGKSRLASEIFPAWCFGRASEWSLLPGETPLEFIESSYDYALARNFGRAVRNIIKDPTFSLLFPQVSLSPDATAMDEWKTTFGGEYKAEGVGGGLVGFHGHIAVIDDPVKGYAEASSADQRESVWNWYSGTLLNRLRSYKGGPGSVILIMQRWHDDDLGGRLEKLSLEGEEHWEILRLPSLAEEGDPLGRAPGEPLLPDGPNRRTLEELRQLQGRNPRLFMALHQQKPVAEQGDIFQPRWLQLYGPEDLPKKLTYYISSDFALTKNSGDFSVLLAFGICPEGHVWLLDMWRAQVEIDASVEASVDMMLKWKASRFLLEKVSLARVFSPLLAKRRKERRAWTVVEEVSLFGKGSKDSPDRAGAIAGAMQLGYVHVPLHAPWRGELEHELAQFPNGKHDDQVDALSLMGIRLDVLRGKGKDPLPKKPEPLKFSPITFQQVMEINRRARQGRSTKRMAFVVPWETKPSPLDDGILPPELGVN